MHFVDFLPALYFLCAIFTLIGTAVIVEKVVEKVRKAKFDPDDTQEMPFQYVNTGRLKFKRASMGMKTHDVSEDDTIEVTFPPEIVEPAQASKGSQVVYVRDRRQRPFGYFLGTDRSGRILVQRFKDKLRVRRSSRTVLVLA